MFSELLDASASGLWEVFHFVNNLVTLVLGTSTILSGNSLLDNFKLTLIVPSFCGVHGVSVHLEEVQVDFRETVSTSPSKEAFDLEPLVGRQ